MRLSCPCCHAEISLDAAVQGEAAAGWAELLSGLAPAVAVPLVEYVALWRSRTRALAWERSIKIARGALALDEDPRIMAEALSRTVEAVRQKQTQHGWKPLSSHQYLSSVVISVRSEMTARRALGAAPPAAAASRSSQAVYRLGQHGHSRADVPSWLAEPVCRGLASLVLLRLPGAPALDNITGVADEWIDTVRSRSDLTADNGPALIARGFRALKTEIDKWPAPAELLRRIPRLPGSARIEPGPVRREPTTEEVLAEHERLRGQQSDGGMK